MSAKTFDFMGEARVTIHLSKYPSGNTRMDLKDVQDGMNYATASTDMPNIVLLPDEILIKNYSENEGMTDFLVKNNIVTLTHTGMQSGNIWIPVARVNAESEWGKQPAHNPEPLEYNEETGKYTWEMDGFKVSANSYTEAVLMLPFLKQTTKDHL